MSVIPFRRKREESHETQDEFGLPVIAPTPGDLEVSEETAALAKRQLMLRRLLWIAPVIIASLFAVYWLLTLLSNKIDDDLTFPENVRQTWSSPWAGVSASILGREYEVNGWSPSAAEWTPSARLTAKPTWQTALAESLGAHAGLAAQQAESTEGEVDADLSTASRLLTGSVNPSELRAAREALLSYDGRVRRHTISGAVSAEHFAERLVLMADWAKSSNRELMDVFHTADGFPLDDHAVVSVYRARARAYVSHRLISAMDTHYRDEIQPYREAALRSWARAAEFSPLFIINGAPDSMFFTSHAASMRALLLEANEATLAYASALAPDFANDTLPVDMVDPRLNEISYKN